MKLEDVINDISIENLKYNDYYGQMWSLQKTLMDRYIAIGALPKYPFIKYTKAEQLQLRDLVGRVTGELSEWYAEYRVAMEVKNVHKLSSEHIYRIHEEFSDVLHFVIEILVYSNITITDLVNLLVKVCAQDKATQPLLYEGMGFYEAYNTLALMKLPEYGISIRELRSGIPYLADITQYQPGLWLSSCEVYERLLWQCTHSLEKALNLLKAKPWVQNPEEPDLETYQYNLGIWAINFFMLSYYLGYDQESLNRIYRAKNKINHHRLDTKR